MMGATEIATLYLDRQLQIQRFTAGVRELFSIRDEDRGRHISDLTHKLGYSEFVEDAERVLRSLMLVEREVQTPEGNWFVIRLRPYRTREDRTEGVVTSFIDINKLKRAEQELQEANDKLEERVFERTQELDASNQQLSQARDMFYSLFNANPVPAALINLKDYRFLSVNNEFLNYFGFQPEDVVDHNAGEFNLSMGLETASRQEWLTQVQREGKIRNYETEILHPSGEKRNILASIQYISLDHTDALISTFIDITERVRAERQVRSLAYDLTAAEQAERLRISQILHDDLQQRLFAIQMQMSFLKDAYEKNDLRAYQMEFPQLETWLAEAIQVTRHLSVNLSPPVLRGEGLREALIWLAAQMQEQYNLNIAIETNGTSIVLDDKLRVLLFNAIREVLFNIVKHSHTLEAKVTLESQKDHLRVTVSDGGVGFDPEDILTKRKGGHGLLIMKDRLNLLGCSLQIESEPGNGTVVIIEAPYEPPDNEK
jgi:two-component system CheB/CheR fusion protein